MRSGGSVLVEGLVAAGVEVAFGLPGVHNLAAWKALARSPIRLVGVRHEQTAGYAADGYARATGRLGIALTTTGPGAANTLGAVGEAWASGSPLLVVATDIPTGLRRAGVYRGVLHETVDQAGMFAPVTKATVRVAEVADLASAVLVAVEQALTPPTRPVYLEVPTDLLGADASAAPAASTPRAPAVPSPADGDLELAATLLTSAAHPLIWAGGGALRAGARDSVALLAERLAAPVLVTYQARGLLPPRHPCAVGLPPHMPQAGALWDEADVVVAIGSDFDGMTTQNWAQPQPPQLVAINVDRDDATKNYRADVVLTGDAAAVTAALADRVPPRSGIEQLRERLAARRAAARADLEAEQPRAVAFLDAFATAVPDDAVVVVDMCIPGYWLGAFHPVSAPRRFAYPVGWGTLGFAFPAALGAASAGTGPVVSVSGDGGFLYAPGELATVAQERIPLTAVIVDDGGYGMLRYDQRAAGDATFGVDLHSPDFAALAAAFGVEAETVDGLGDAFAAALARQCATDTPTVLVARAALDPPPTTSPRWYRRRR
jgi:thiamine pyrophosphate-dependent acetolactate synthase large subunit-like protein